MTLVPVTQSGFILCLSHRQMHDGGNEEGTLKWMESGHKGDRWQEGSVFVKHNEAFWVRKR